MGAAFEGFGGVAVFGGGAEAFELVELFGGHEAAGDAFGGFVHEAVPEVAGDGLERFPRRVVALVTRPHDLAAVKNDQDLIFALFGIADPPTKFHCHDGCG